MPRLCLDRQLLGTKEHLVCDEGSYWWTQRVPEGAWHLSGRAKDDSDWCLDTALRLGGHVPDLQPPAPFVKEMSLLSDSLGTHPIPWQRVMPRAAHLAFTKRLAGEVAVATAAAPLDYYRTVWVPGNGIFRALHRCGVDAGTWRQLVDAGEGNVAATRSFQPDDEGLAREVDYDRFRTLTGRLTVKAGPQILTLKKKHRSIMRSVYGDKGRIVGLDFAALEARILLYEHGRRCEEADLYGTIAQEMGHDRNSVKAAVLSLLYGSSKWALGARLGISGAELDAFVRKVQAYFNTEELLARVKAQFVATGKIIDRYGRPISVDEPLDHIFIAYYGQATGVGVTMLGFRQVVDRLAAEAPRVRPVFLLHDAIILDVHDDDLPAVQAISHVKVPGYVQRFPLRLEKVGS